MSAMTSASLLPAAPVAVIDSAPSTPTRSPQAHRRRSSRNPHGTPRPSVAMDPGLHHARLTQHHDGEEDDAAGRDHSNMMGADLHRRRPLPLPDFTFNPGADLPPERAASPVHPVLQEMALNQQRAIRSARPAPLPSFTFAPNAASAQASPSPTKSTFGDALPAARGGHRRGGSEFVGGGNDGSHLVSTSPEKAEYRPHPPVAGAARGHAHRRSQAISISDIDTSELIKANAVAKARAGSTPTTPAEGAQAVPFPRPSPKLHQSLSNIVHTPSSSPRRRGSAPGVRPRVGFADHVDVIPRPLSLISSETEGSSSTIRGGHSLSGSINSIASPTPRHHSLLSGPSDASPSPERPQTADAMSTMSPGMHSPAHDAVSLINLPKRPLSASGSPGATNTGGPPSKKKYFWLTHSNSSSPSATPRVEPGDPMDVFATHTPPRASVDRPTSPPVAAASESVPKSKKHKYHTWTSGIFSRRTDKRASKTKRPAMPIPVALTRRPSDRLNDIFDADDTIVIREPSPVSPRIRDAARRDVGPILQSWESRQVEHQAPSPLIDLDAALGPFGSEEKLGADGGSRTPSSVRIAKLHSSERRATMDAFGIVHRRTESAPTMPAVNRNSFSMQRKGSKTSLTEDVFDEEEEDNFLAGEEADRRTSEDQPAPDTSSPRLGAGLGFAMVGGGNDAVVIVDPEEDVARGEARSSNSTLEAPVLATFETPKRPMSSPVLFAYPAPSSHYASSTEGRTTSTSIVSSPDVDHVSFDTRSRPPRVLGEQSPEFVLRASNDDLPSLSDSLSSAALPRFSSSAGTRSSVEQRSASVMAPVPSKSNLQQDWKRASLASLNRLIPGSSNGSKLKFETMADSASFEERTKKKTNRLSRLVLFWRSKEKTER